MESEAQIEDARYLQEQIITYLGNKRHLLSFIGEGIRMVQQRLGRSKLCCVDAFSGSGIVSRYLKQFSECLYTNDLEDYARVLNTCYLANSETVHAARLPERFAALTERLPQELAPGLLAAHYAPQDDAHIRPGERVFYTRRNAVYLDSARRLIGEQPEEVQPFFLAPLLYAASVHTNTSGVFKGFYKNAEGVGQFGGRARNALQRICADIELQLPVFSRFDCEHHVLQGDAAKLPAVLPELDIAYVDPPYNQHPYGSNYFMLNLLLRNELPADCSPVSGIPTDWNRSAYNRRREAAESLRRLLAELPTRFILVSYNSEGFINPQEMKRLLTPLGRVKEMVTDYATFRGCRNLRSRALKVQEYLYLLEK
ncbi:MAG: DNA adenine methylase [Akkermansia sp.]|nr:DNA adenine methylase [Akkermansia sp.]